LRAKEEEIVRDGLTVERVLFLLWLVGRLKMKTETRREETEVLSRIIVTVEKEGHVASIWKKKKQIFFSLGFGLTLNFPVFVFLVHSLIIIHRIIILSRSL
jgi:hypothetical protein